MDSTPPGNSVHLGPAGSIAFGLGFSSLLLFTLLLYWPGLTGPLVLDDIWNLQRLGESGGVRDWASFLQFVFDNDSGPSGRPVSMLAFLLDAQDWPPRIAALKYSNILFHLLTGAAVCWFTLLLARQLGLSEPRAAGIALAVAALWLLHPLNATTTMYVVQRMTQLMALFALLALVFYLKGRANMQQRPGLSLVCLGLCLFPFALLSLLSKENGALLLLLIVIMDAVLFRAADRTRLFRFWYRGGVLLPLLLVAAYLVYSAPESMALYEIRHFGLLERLLTEARVLLVYLWKMLFPNLVGGGLFHDDIEISRGLLSPLTTLPSLLAVLGLLLSGWLLRRLHPVFSFAVFWFFAMHLLESTYLPLEPYFEHRNYLAMVGPLFAVVWYAEAALNRGLKQKNGGHAAQTIGLALLGILLLMSWLTLSQARLWSDGAVLHATWAEQRPRSVRAQLTFAEYLNALGQPELAMERLELARQHHPNEVTVLLNVWNQACGQGYPRPFTLAQLQANPELEYFRDDVNHHLRILLENLFDGRCPYPDQETMIGLFDRIEQFPLTANRRATFHVLFSDLYVSYGRLDPALINLNRAAQTNPSPRLPLRQAMLSAAAGNFEDSLVFLQRAEAADRSRNPLLPSVLDEITALRAQLQMQLDDN